MILSPHLDVIAPLVASSQSNADPIGAVVLVIDANQYLYPLIQSWPIPDSSAETLLVRQDGDTVLFLNELRYQSDTALKLRIPLTQTNVPAVMAVQGREGIVQGLDYRGVSVLSALQAIPDTSWFMIAKVDTAEVFADWHTRSVLIVVLLLGLLATVGTGAGLVWQGSQNTHYRTLLQIEQTRRESEARYRSLFENMLNGLGFHRMLYEQGRPQDYIFLEVNKAFEEQTGLKDVIGKRVTEVLPGIREFDPELFEIYGRVALGGEPESFETYVESLKEWVSVSVFSFEKEYFVTAFDVITERKLAEDALRRANRAYRTLSDGNQALLRAESEPALLQSVCDAVVNAGGYSLVWVGFAEHDERKTVRPVAFAGHEAGFLNTTDMTWADTEAGQRPVGQAIRSGAPVAIEYLAKDVNPEAWHKAVLERGYKSMIALPIEVDDQIIGALSIYAAESAAFTGEEIVLLVEMTADLAYGIRALRTRADRERAQEILAQERNLLRTLIDNLPDSIYAKDAEGRFLLKNRADAALMGAKSTAEVVGKTDFDYYPPELAEQFHADDQQVMESGKPLIDREEPNIDAQGNTRWLLTTKVPLRDDQGGVIGLVGIGRDITEHKQTEEAIRELNAELEQRVIERTEQLNRIKERVEAILNSSTDVILLCRTDGFIDQVNPAVENVFGCRPEEVLNQSLSNLVISEHAAAVEGAFTELIANQQPQRIEVTAQFKEAAAFDTDVVMSPMIEQSKGLLGVVCSLRDITQRKQMEVQLREALESEQELNELKSRVVSIVSHEFRNPLAAIASSSQLLRNYRDQIPEERRIQNPGRHSRPG